MRRVFSVIGCLVVLLGMSVFPQKVNAQYSYISFSSGGSNFSSETDTIVGSDHSTYYVKLDRFKFGSNSMNVMPYAGALIHARIYRLKNGVLKEAGDCAHFSTNGNGYNYNYWVSDGFGKSGDVHRLKSNSNVSDSCTACFVWNA